MANSTLSLQTHGSKAQFTNAEKMAATILNANGGMSLQHQANISNSIELNGEDFILLPVSGRAPRFSLANTQRGMKPAPGSTTIHAFKAEKETENEVSSAFAASLFGALFPVSGILETIKHFVEVTHKMSEGNSRNIKFTETQNINPKDVINPNKSFLPHTPFFMPNKPTLELWQKKKQTLKDVEEKKKKKIKGLGSF